MTTPNPTNEEWEKELSEIIEDFDKEITALEEGAFTKKGYDIAISYLRYAHSRGRESGSNIELLTQEREKAKWEALQELIELAEPYDGAKWHNQISIEQIKKVLSPQEPDTLSQAADEAKPVFERAIKENEEHALRELGRKLRER